MSRVHHPIALFALFSSLVVCVLSGCIDSGDPVGVEPYDVALNPSQVADGCPSWEDACDEISGAVQTECPPDGDWKNRGQLMSCRKKTTNRPLKGVEECFSDEELADLRECVLSRSLDTPVVPDGNSKVKMRTE